MISSERGAEFCVQLVDTLTEFNSRNRKSQTLSLDTFERKKLELSKQSTIPRQYFPKSSTFLRLLSVCVPMAHKNEFGKPAKATNNNMTTD